MRCRFAIKRLLVISQTRAQSSMISKIIYPYQKIDFVISQNRFCDITTKIVVSPILPEFFYISNSILWYHDIDFWCHKMQLWYHKIIIIFWYHNRLVMTQIRFLISQIRFCIYNYCSWIDRVWFCDIRQLFWFFEITKSIMWYHKFDFW